VRLRRSSSRFKRHRTFAHDRASSTDADSECAAVFAHNLDVNFARAAQGAPGTILAAEIPSPAQTPTRV